MPQLRKVAPHEAETWDLETAPFVIEAMLTRIAGADRTGLTRIDRPGAAGGEHAWRARVYVGGGEQHRQFADSVYGGPEGALRAALAWRDIQRQQVARPPHQRRRSIVRVDRPDWNNVGYFAWREGKRRYFSDARYGGPDGAKDAATAWAGMDLAT